MRKLPDQGQETGKVASILKKPRFTVNALLSPQGAYLMLGPKKGELIREGGLTELLR